MAVREIVTIGDDKLRKKCKNVESFDERLHALLNDMADTMYAQNGVGLAAPQIGILRRICVVDVLDDTGIHEFINPEIVEEEGCQEGPEGCLSVPGRSGIVARPKRIKVRAYDRYGKEFSLEAEDFFARAICHEIDHLNGRLYVDIMERELTEEDFKQAAKRRVYRRANKDR